MFENFRVKDNRLGQPAFEHADRIIYEILNSPINI